MPVPNPKIVNFMLCELYLSIKEVKAKSFVSPSEKRANNTKERNLPSFPGSGAHRFFSWSYPCTPWINMEGNCRVAELEQEFFNRLSPLNDILKLQTVLIK